MTARTIFLSFGISQSAIRSTICIGSRFSLPLVIFANFREHFSRGDKFIRGANGESKSASLEEVFNYALSEGE